MLIFNAFSFTCAVKQYDGLLITATVDVVMDWSPSQEQVEKLRETLADSERSKEG